MATSEASGKLLPLVGYVNRKTDEIPFFRKAVYLLVLWYVSNSNIPMEEGPGFTVPKMAQMCGKFLQLKHFDRTKVAYEVLDDFVKNKLAASRSADGVTLYTITQEGAARAIAVMDEFTQAMNVENGLRQVADQYRRPERLPLGPAEHLKLPSGVQPEPEEMESPEPPSDPDLTSLSPVELYINIDRSNEYKFSRKYSPLRREILGHYRRILNGLNITPQDAVKVT